MKKIIILAIFFVSLSSICFSQTAEQKAMMEKMMQQMGGQVKFEKTYTFNHTITIQMSSTDNKGETTVAKHYLTTSGNHYAMATKTDNKKVMLIVDEPNNSNVSLMEEDGEKQGISMAKNDAMTNSATVSYTSNTINKNSTFIKTGETKNIAGQTCYKYIAKNDGAVAELWFANVNINTTKSLGIIDMKNMSGDVPQDFPKGLLMEMKSKEKDGTEVHYKVISLQLNTNITINTATYNVQSMSDMMKNIKY